MVSGAAKSDNLLLCLYDLKLKPWSAEDDPALTFSWKICGLYKAAKTTLSRHVGSPLRRLAFVDFMDMNNGSERYFRVSYSICPSSISR